MDSNCSESSEISLNLHRLLGLETDCCFSVVVYVVEDDFVVEENHQTSCQTKRLIKHKKNRNQTTEKKE